MISSVSARTLPHQSSAPREWARDLPPPVVMMGVPFDQVTTLQALGLIEEMITSRRPHMLATANMNFLAQAQEDASLRGILLKADLVVCDGTPLVWVSRWLGDPLPERVAGSDLVPLLLAVAEEKGYSVYFLGGRDEVLATAQKAIRSRWPALKIAGAWSPPFAPLEKMDHAEIRRRLDEAAPDILLVSFGCPKQEKWIAMNLQAVSVPVSMGVGATIDFLSGTLKRAPVWMRRTGLEWIFRIIQEPKRLAGRYRRDIEIVGPGLLHQLWQMRGRGFFQRRGAAAPARGVSVSAASPHDSSAAAVELLVLPARLDALAAREASRWTAAEKTVLAWIIADASETTFIDSTGTGKLVRLARACRERGGQFILVAPGPVLLQTLTLMRLREFFMEAPTVDAARAVIPAAAQPAPLLLWTDSVSAATLAPLDAFAFELLENLPPGGSMTIDLKAVNFMDSSGVGLMLRLQRRARQRRIDLAFIRASSQVRMLLGLLRMESYLLADSANASS